MQSVEFTHPARSIIAQFSSKIEYDLKQFIHKHKKTDLITSN